MGRTNEGKKNERERKMMMRWKSGVRGGGGGQGNAPYHPSIPPIPTSIASCFERKPRRSRKANDSACITIGQTRLNSRREEDEVITSISGRNENISLLPASSRVVCLPRPLFLPSQVAHFSLYGREAVTMPSANIPIPPDGWTGTRTAAVL